MAALELSRLLLFFVKVLCLLLESVLIFFGGDKGAAERKERACKTKSSNAVFSSDVSVGIIVLYYLKKFQLLVFGSFFSTPFDNRRLKFNLQKEVRNLEGLSLNLSRKYRVVFQPSKTWGKNQVELINR